RMPCNSQRSRVDARKAIGAQLQLVKSQRQIPRDVEGSLAPQRAIDLYGRGVVGVLKDLTLTAVLQDDMNFRGRAIMHVDIKGLLRTRRINHSRRKGARSTRQVVQIQPGG